MLKYVADYFFEVKKNLILESENPDFGENKEERAKRIAFYLKNGGEIIQTLNYLLPPLDGTIHTEMKLIVFNKKASEIGNKELKNLVFNVYRQIYKRGLDDKYLMSILESIQ